LTGELADEDLGRLASTAKVCSPRVSTKVTLSADALIVMRASIC
jgi:hypothetical protein